MKKILQMTAMAISLVLAIQLAGKAQPGSGNPETRATLKIELADKAAFSLSGKKVTLGDAIRLVLEQNRDTLSGAYDVAMTDSMYRKFQAKYSPYLNLESAVAQNKYPESMGTLYGSEKKSWNMSASIAKMFSSGTTLAAGLKHDYAKTTYQATTIPTNNGDSITLSGFGAPEYHQPVMFASIKQELLKNAFGYNDRRQVEILRNQSTIQRETIVNYLAGLVVQVVVDYWTVVVNSSALENAELQLRETVRVRNIIAQNVRIGLAESFDLNYYNSLVASSESRKFQAQQQYRDSLRNLLQTLNLDSGIRIDGTAVLTAALPAVNQDLALKAAYAKRADYLNARLAAKNAQLSLDMYENQGMPSMTAELNVSSMAQQQTYGEAYSDASSGSYPSWEGKVTFTYPLDDQEQKTNVRDARFKVKQAKLQLDKYQRVVRDDITTKIEHIETYYRLYNKARETTQQSETYYRRMLGNLQRGRFTAAVVKNGLDAMVESRQRELEALVQFNVSLLKFDLAKNELFDRYNVDVNKYIPRSR